MNFEKWIVILLVLNVSGWIADINTEFHNYTVIVASLSANVACVWFAREVTLSGESEFTKRTVSDFNAIVTLVVLIMISGSLAYFGYLKDPFEIKDTGRYRYYSWIFGYFVASICAFFVYLLIIYLIKLSRESKNNKRIK